MMANEPKVDEESAAAEVDRICDAYHVETDVSVMGEAERRAFEANCNAAKRAVMLGKLELGDDGLASFTAGSVSLKFAKPTGESFIAMDGHDGTFKRGNAAIRQLTGAEPGVVEGLPAKDWQALFSLVNLFL